MTKQKQIEGLPADLAARKPAYNYEGITLADGDNFLHALNTTKIDAYFFNNGTRKNIHADWEVTDPNNIKYYGPPFTGDIFIIKRA